MKNKTGREEKQGGVHSKEKVQVKKKGLTAAEQYAEHSKLSYDRCDGDTWVDVTAERVKDVTGNN